MSVVSSNNTILVVEELRSKSDLITVSNSLVIVLDSYEEARIVQQIHSWIKAGQGVIIDGYRWFDISIQDWIAEVIPTASNWKMRSYLNSLVKKGVLEREHLFKVHHGHNYSPRNRTYYYRLDYERLSELASIVIASRNATNTGGAE